MKLPFRQGIVSYQVNGLGMPQYLTASPVNGFVQLNIAATPLVATVAHGTSDYLLTFSNTIPAAWGPIPAAVAPTGATYHLYWDINQQTGAVTFGYTLYTPQPGGAAPPSPAIDQHWFDTEAKVMKVWRGDKWFPVLRGFAGKVPGANIANISASDMEPDGLSWKNVLAVPGNPGYIETDIFNKPIYMPNWEFLTTDTPVRVKTTVGSSGILVTPTNAFVPVKASENIPRMSLVYFSGANTVALASGNPALNPPRHPVGIVQEELSFNEMGNVTFQGQITYDQWDWSAHQGAALYCGTNGALTTVRPNSLQAYRVGFVKDTNTIVFRIDSETLPQVYTAESSDIVINGVPPLNAAFSISAQSEALWTITIPPATTSVDGYMTMSQVLELGSLDARVSANEIALAGKAEIIHTHLISEVTGLQEELNLKSDVGHTHPGVFAPYNHNHDSVYTKFNHIHSINSVDGLQPELNAKAYRVHAHSLDEVYDSVNRSGLTDVGQGPTLRTVLSSKMPAVQGAVVGNIAIFGGGGTVTDSSTPIDGFALTVHTHAIADVASLAQALDAKAPALHVHNIDGVTGLQTALNLKSDTTHDHNGVYSLITHNHTGVYASVAHGHSINTIVDLQEELDAKAPLVHTHVIADITDLQPALDLKSNTDHDHDLVYAPYDHNHDGIYADIIHIHSINSVDNLPEELDGKIGFDNVTVFTPTDDYNPATKLYVDEAIVAAVEAIPQPVVRTGIPSASAAVGYVVTEIHTDPTPIALLIPDLPASTHGFRQFRPFPVTLNHATTGDGDYGTEALPEYPLIWRELNEAGNRFNGTIGFMIGSTGDAAGAEWQFTFELVLDPTYLGFLEDYPTNNTSKKTVTVGFQLWKGTVPINDDELNSYSPIEVTATQVVLQKNAIPAGTGQDISLYAARFTASMQTWLPADTYYVTWNSLDIPGGDDLVPPTNGQRFSQVVGLRIAGHRIYNGGPGV